MDKIFLDVASGAKPVDTILPTIAPYIEEHWHNPSSVYSSGVSVNKDIEEVRQLVADLICANDKSEIVLNSGATEGNNHVIRGWDDAHYNDESVIITTPIEHKSIMMAVENPVLQSEVCYCEVTPKGFVNVESLQLLLEKHKGKHILVSVGAANSEIGTMQHLDTISNLVHSYPDTTFHTDATQLIPWYKVDVNELCIDLLTASSQKFGGLRGTGFMYIRNGAKISPLLYGAQENAMRGGTPNVVGIIAMGEAIMMQIDYNKSLRVGWLRDEFIDRLILLGCTLNGAVSFRLPNNINVTLPHHIDAESMLYMLDTSGVEVSAGSACNSHSIEGSYVIKAIGKEEEARSSIRITFDETLTIEDVDYVVHEIENAITCLMS